MDLTDNNRTGQMPPQAIKDSGDSTRTLPALDPGRIQLRLERPEDYFDIESLTRKAFWNLFKAGCDEHFLLHRLRQDPAYLPDLAFVAEYEGRLIGSIHYSRSRLLSAEGSYPAITFGPVSVLPDYQKHGIGSRLIRHTIELARAMGHPAIIIYGHPDYYPRFGFKSFAGTRVTTEEGTQPDYFMGLELKDNYFRTISGTYQAAAAFTGYTPEEVEEFEKLFSADPLPDFSPPHRLDNHPSSPPNSN